jgi:glycosyltransferase involved in cell wall biosynthesis
MRVYVLTPSFPPTLGGQEKHLLELVGGLIEAGAASMVLTRRSSKEVPAAERLGRVPVRRFSPTGAIKGVGLVAAPRLSALLAKMIACLLWEQRHYDVVLVSGFNFMPFAPVLAGLFTRKPCVVRPESPLEVSSAVGPEAQQRMGLKADSLPLRLINRLRSAAARRVDRYVAISAEIRSGLIRAGIAQDRIVSIPNGIDVNQFAPVDSAVKSRLRTKLGLPPLGLLIVYTGRLAHSKGVMMLLSVWQQLAALYPQAHLLMVGSGQGCFDNCEPEMRACIAAGDLSARVTLTGAVANVQEFLQASDVFAFPSDYEGFSLSILESMTAALPMVCTRVGVAAELESKHSAPIGLLVAPKDAAAFGEALRRLLDDEPLRRNLGQSAAQAVRCEYSLEVEVGRYLDLFATLTRAPA